MTPAWRTAAATALVSFASGSRVAGSTNSTAIMAPRPRISPMRGSGFCSKCSRMIVSIFCASVSSPSSSMASMTASAAAVATGLPP